jgi:predicted nuclease of predicted toxin-antitoxin system
MKWTKVPWTKREKQFADRVDIEYKSKARFLVDENMGEQIRDALVELGYNTVTANDLRMQGQPDENIYAATRTTDRILLTHDEDFLSDRAFTPKLSPGVVVLPGATSSKEQVLDSLLHVLGAIGHIRNLWRGTKIKVNSDGSWVVKTFEPSLGMVQTTRYRFIGQEVETYEEPGSGWK